MTTYGFVKELKQENGDVFWFVIGKVDDKKINEFYTFVEVTTDAEIQVFVEADLINKGY